MPRHAMPPRMMVISNTLWSTAAHCSGVKMIMLVMSAAAPDPARFWGLRSLPLHAALTPMHYHAFPEQASLRSIGFPLSRSRSRSAFKWRIPCRATWQLAIHAQRALCAPDPEGSKLPVPKGIWRSAFRSQLDFIRGNRRLRDHAAVNQPSLKGIQGVRDPALRQADRFLWQE